MGNPSLDYERDRHLVSGCYCGRIDSFENSINDTAGNFALFTSSSTEPFNTKLNTEQTTTEMEEYSLTENEIQNDTYNKDTFKYTMDRFKNIYWSSPCNNEDYYNIQLSNKNYFTEGVWPKYIVLDSEGNPVTGLKVVNTYSYSSTTNDNKKDILTIKISNGEQYDASYTIIVIYSFYKEKYIITRLI